MEKWNKNKIVIPIGLTLLGFIYDIYFHIRHGIELLNSDYVTEVMIADLLNKTHSPVLLKDFFYGTELRVFETQWIYRLCLLIFPNNWHMVRVLGMALFLALLVIGIVLLFKAFDMEYYGWWVSALSMLPLGYWYIYLFSFGSFYIPYALFSFYTLLVLVKATKSEGRKRQIYLVILGFLALSSGLNGVRQFMILFAPMVLASFVMLLNKEKENVFVFLSCIYATFLNVVGVGINIVILSKQYFFEASNEYVWGQGNGSLLTSLRWFEEMFGFTQNHAEGLFYTNGIVSLLSRNGIAKGCGLLLGMLVFISALYLLFIFKRLTMIEKYLTLLTISMVFVISVVLAYLYGTMQYFVQTMPFGYALIVLAIKNMPKINIVGRFSWIKEIQKDAVAIIIMFMAIISASGSARSLVELPFLEYTKKDIGTVVDWIGENTDYTKGCSDYWTGNLITGLTNGQTEMYVVTESYSPKHIAYWHQKMSHVEEFESLSHFFVLCEYNEAGQSGTFLSNDDIIYFDGNYVVYGIEEKYW